MSRRTRHSVCEAVRREGGEREEDCEEEEEEEEEDDEDKDMGGAVDDDDDDANVAERMVDAAATTSLCERMLPMSESCRDHFLSSVRLSICNDLLECLK